MKFQVSLLNQKGIKKPILDATADRFEETPDGSFTNISFYSEDAGFWSTTETLVASCLVEGLYVVEQIADIPSEA